MEQQYSIPKLAYRLHVNELFICSNQHTLLAVVTVACQLAGPKSHFLCPSGRAEGKLRTTSRPVI